LPKLIKYQHDGKKEYTALSCII